MGWAGAGLSVTLSHKVSFEVTLKLPPVAAVAFVRDAEASLARADFIENLELAPDPPLMVVRAHLPVNASLFGQQRLEFRSRLHPTPQGARLEALPLETREPGWAEISGEAEVAPTPQGSSVTYHFNVTIHLRLPKAEKWGTRALSKMIEYTAKRVLENISARFPAAIQEAAREVEASYVV